MLQGTPINHQSPQQLQTEVETRSPGPCALHRSASPTLCHSLPSFSLPFFHFLLFESDTGALWSLFRTEWGQYQMLNSAFSVPAVVPIHFDLYTTTPLFPSPTSAEEAGWPLWLVRDDLARRRVNGSRSQSAPSAP